MSSVSAAQTTQGSGSEDEDLVSHWKLARDPR